MLANGPPTWDSNHDGVYTCEEWKSFVDRLFTLADRNRDGSLSPSEFRMVQKADATLADADFGYFDENQDGKITRKEFVEKPTASLRMKSRRGPPRRVRKDRSNGRGTGFTENGKPADNQAEALNRPRITDSTDDLSVATRWAIRHPRLL
jgi:EF-hand domain pair